MSRSIRRYILTALLTGLVTTVPSLLSAMPAQASIGGVVLADCNAHDALTATYSVAQLQNALATMPATMVEYTDCHDVIQRALLAQTGKGGNNGSGNGSGGSFLPTPVIVILVLLVLAALTFGAIEVRRRRN